MIHSRSKAWVRLMGLGLALLLMCPVLPVYAFAEEPTAAGSAAAQSAETDPAQTAPAQTAPAQAQSETAQPQTEPETPSDETVVEPAADNGVDAAIYYLADPAGDPLTNDTGAWAPSRDSSTLIARLDTTGASWDHNNGQNITINVAKYITAWPDGSNGSTWTVKRDDPKTGGNFTYILHSIWTAYEAAVKKETGQDARRT